MRALALIILVVTLGAGPASAVPPPSEGWDARRVGKGAFDLFLMRPLNVAQLVVGSAMFVVFYPVTLLTGGEDQVVEYFVKDPAKTAFQRPLGEL